MARVSVIELVVVVVAVLLVAVAEAASSRARRLAEAHPADVRFLEKLGDWSEVDGSFDLNDVRRRRLQQTEGAMDFTVEAFGKEHAFELETHKTLFHDKYKHVMVHGNGTMEVASHERDCVYKSSCGGVFSLCGGKVHAKFSRDGDEMEMAALPSGKHVVFRRRELLEERKGHCGINEDNEPDFEVPVNGGRRLRGEHDHAHDHDHTHANAGMSSRRSLAGTREVDLVVVNDASRVADVGSAVESSSAFITSLVADLYTDLPSSDPTVVRLVGMISLMEPSASFNTNAGNSGRSVNANTVLENFRTWANANTLAINSIFDHTNSFDHAHLLHGTDFYNGTDGSAGDGVVGLAYVGGVCGVSGQGITQANYADSTYVANIFTHELGHNLGMQHTNVAGSVGPTYTAPSSPCNDANDYIMDPSASIDPSWSSCTHEYWDSKHSSFGAGSTCTDLSSDVWTPPVCGNGIREAGEDCDCLLGDCGADTTCNGATCTLLPGNDCWSEDACCTSSGSLESSGTTCRATRTGADADCDVGPETCDGVNAACPVDVVEDAGTSCGSGLTAGTCYLGECKSLNQQCIEIGYPLGACGFGTQSCSGSLRCSLGGAPESCQSPTGFIPDDGSPCSSGVCFQGTCISDPTTLPDPADLAQCSDGVQNGDETDVDCGGGSCLPCFGGSNCTLDSDCQFPGFCNETSGVCDSTPGGGIDDNPGDEEDPDYVAIALDFLSKIKDWAIANPLLAGVAGGGLGLLILACCICCFCCGGKDKVPKYAKQASFRMRGGRQPADGLVPVARR